MAQQTAPGRPLSSQGTSTRRRTLLLTVLLLVAVAGLVFVWRGSNTKSGSGASGSNHRVVAIQASKTKTASSGHRTGTRTGAKHKSGTHKGKPDTSARALYAQQLLPILDRSRSVFDNTAAGASRASSNLGALGSSCGRFENQLSILSTRADDIPHPYGWWTRIGQVHRRMMGIYNNMLGALANCIDASQSGESDTAVTSISDMGTADHNMRHFDDYARWLSKHG